MPVVDYLVVQLEIDKPQSLSLSHDQLTACTNKSARTPAMSVFLPLDGFLHDGGELVCRPQPFDARTVGKVANDLADVPPV